MKFATDLDDCIIDTGNIIFDLISEEMNVDFGDRSSYKIEDYGIDPDIVRKYINRVLESDNLKFFPDAVDVLNQIGLENELYIISHRKNYLYNHTLSTLKNAKLKNFKLILTPDKIVSIPDKSSIINDLGINIMVEDRPDIIKDISDNTSADVIIFDRPWNKNCRGIRMYNWKEISEFILNERFLNYEKL